MDRLIELISIAIAVGLFVYLSVTLGIWAQSLPVKKGVKNAIKECIEEGLINKDGVEKIENGIPKKNQEARGGNNPNESNHIIKMY